MIMRLGTKTRQCKQIVNGLLYDTQKATQVAWGIFVTNSGRYFKVDVKEENEYEYSHEYVEDKFEQIQNCTKLFIYSNIQPLTEEEAKAIIGLEEVDKYIELFGEVEEA